MIPSRGEPIYLRPPALSSRARSRRLAATEEGEEGEEAEAVWQCAGAPAAAAVIGLTPAATR
jgi:hypothetical protein